MVADLSTAIEESLKEIGEFTLSERCYIIQYNRERMDWSMTYEWCNEISGIAQPIIQESQNLSTDTYPWFSAQLLSGMVIKVNNLDNLPINATPERKALLSSKTPCLLIVPMLDEVGQTVGYLGLDAVEGHEWAEEDVNLLKLAGELIAIAGARHEAQLELRGAKEEADRANRAKTQFLAHMSHELRTPLNSILGFTRLMAKEQDLKSEQKEYLEIINRSGEHLLELIDDILEMSKIEAGGITFNPVYFDLYELLDNLQEMLQAQALEKGLALIFDRSTTLPQYLFTDRGKLRQVLINIVGNGIKFTESGSVTLKAFSGERQKISFEIEDTGVGIAPSEIELLFEPFVQTRSGAKSGQGTGLGLPISKKFIELLGGNLRVSSVLNKGTLFCFDIKVELARKQDIKDSNRKRNVLGIASEQSPYKILVVDDLSESRYLLVKILSGSNLCVKEAENGEIAVRIWQEWQPDLIWMDMRMTVMDGYQATHEIRSLEKLTGSSHTTKIIALTASAFEEEKNLILSCGCDDFVGKPFLEETIWAKMNQHLGLEYIYGDRHPSASEEKKASLAQFEVISEDLKQQLQKAAQECNDEKILDLLEGIDDNFALSIKSMAKNFLFENILQIL